MLAAALVPAAIAASKPLAKKVANGLIVAGEKLKEAVDEVQSTDEKPKAHRIRPPKVSEARPRHRPDSPRSARPAPKNESKSKEPEIPTAPPEPKPRPEPEMPSQPPPKQRFSLSDEDTTA